MNEGIEVHGSCEDRFLVVKEAFAKNFEKDEDIGASFAATINGKFVIDIWGGYADKEKITSDEKKHKRCMHSSFFPYYFN